MSLENWNLVSDVIKNNKLLSVLRINNCQLNQEKLSIILKSIKDCKYLKILDLGYNQLDDKSYDMINVIIKSQLYGKENQMFLAHLRTYPMKIGQDEIENNNLNMEVDKNENFIKQQGISQLILRNNKLENKSAINIASQIKMGCQIENLDLNGF
ncbi:hypothetical protein PPERSA_10467 [Pseudocohnilembus persalinus]|uniref:Uncharacterized protein n=1 Tax=Pseudocohnilembus persalinus TaxID=266149 RepID=A0A0V0R7M1_PSEPJ|nr:hypothetical protein PPERSA_10467 [Pseudocohnilembus persalinus]|eukprot:KRX10368.1 hypothetical protein PPERSA_10467 [Pseudocohnilembus persalinus]